MVAVRDAADRRCRAFGVAGERCPLGAEPVGEDRCRCLLDDLSPGGLAGCAKSCADRASTPVIITCQTLTALRERRLARTTQRPRGTWQPISTNHAASAATVEKGQSAGRVRVARTLGLLRTLLLTTRQWSLGDNHSAL